MRGSSRGSGCRSRRPEARGGEMTVAPISFAVGVAVLLVGLIVSPLAIAPVGGGIAIAAGVAWVRRRKPRPEPPPRYEETRPERFGRKRLLERATLGLGGLVALGAAAVLVVSDYAAR